MEDDSAKLEDKCGANEHDDMLQLVSCEEEKRQLQSYRST